jgi:hypothetical protein
LVVFCHFPAIDVLDIDIVAMANAKTEDGLLNSINQRDISKDNGREVSREDGVK